jgi:hypothetical protein
MKFVRLTLALCIVICLNKTKESVWMPSMEEPSTTGGRFGGRVSMKFPIRKSGIPLSIFPIFRSPDLHFMTSILKFEV